MIGGEVEGWAPGVGVRYVKGVSSEIGFLRNLPIVPSSGFQRKILTFESPQEGLGDKEKNCYVRSY